MFLYEPVPGFFLQDDPNVSFPDIGAVPPRFGLLDASDARWTTFLARLTQLNESATDGALYKLLFLGRHGQAYHNLAELKYGTIAWDAYWSKLNGDDEFVWGPDAALTNLGNKQARDARAVWKTELAFRAPMPQKAYCSPLTRAIQTHRIVYSAPTPTALVIENLREYYGEHTCDKRRTRSELVADFPEIDIESGFTEEDELWTEVRETEESRRARANDVLERVFRESESGDAQVIAITAHGGIIEEVVRIVGRKWYTSLKGLPTGGILPIVVKAIPVIKT
ncbi:Phosphoglycerate mutase-like protein [Mycena kentingensis (nom. inval.)]|nr:Phosphoglycerate mutase-like protein [Mycena kentingensis (nom. inval.)]